MKFVGHLNAGVAMREVLEEYSPDTGANPADMIELVKAAYSFTAAPPIDAPPEQLVTLIFNGGRYTDGDVSFAVPMLIMEHTGDVVMTVTTDQAELFITDLLFRLDRDLGFRFGTSTKRMSYYSNVVVEFDVALERHIEPLTRMGAAISAAMPDKPQFDLKRLAFGKVADRPPLTQIEIVEMGDFLIERRAGAPVEQNRYYCSAPMRTQDHLRLLEQIEAIALGRANQDTPPA